jgi:hypothetical protein
VFANNESASNEQEHGTNTCRKGHAHRRARALEGGHRPGESVNQLGAFVFRPGEDEMADSDWQWQVAVPNRFKRP